jgi:S1-C subfamily serine protease
MNSLCQRLVMGLGIALAAGFASQAAAQGGAGNSHYLHNPNPVRLGVHYRLVQWPVQGYYVESVDWGSPAQQLGLESGDIITHVNGFAMTYSGAHLAAIGGARSFTLRIRNCRPPYNYAYRSWPAPPSSNPGYWSPGS